MKQHKSSQPRVSPLQKSALILLGLILSLVLLEGGLRLGGWVLSLQEYRDPRSLKEKGAYRILCLGESTTQGQYPSLLEKVLNERDIGVRFSVIDKGIAGATTPILLNRVESFLDEYHPDMVVAMMGINDGGKHTPLTVPTSSEGTFFFQSLRIYQLARLLWPQLFNKVQEVMLGNSEKARPSSEKIQTPLPRTEPQETSDETISTEDSFKKAIEINPNNDHAYVELGWFYKTHRKFSQAEGSFKKAIEINPKNDYAYTGLGRLYLDQGKLSQVETSFKKALALNPENDHTYVEFARFYQVQGEFSKAENSFKKAIEIHPKNDSAYIELGSLYRAQGRLSQAESSFKKAIEIHPEKDRAYIELGWLYRAQVKLPQSEYFFKKAIRLNPKNNDAYAGLGRVYRAQRKFTQAEESFKKVTELDPKNDFAYAGLGRVYQDQGKLSQAEDSFKKAIQLAPGNDNAFIELGWIYQQQNRFSEAEGLLKNALEINPKNDRLLRALSSLYGEMGNPAMEEAYAQKAAGLRETYNPITMHNYLKLKEILDKNRIRLVCVQYPMRNVEPLKKLFEIEDGVIFVDNERVFRKALKKGSYKEYFVDMFGGDFGHGTPKGNMLLAQNIAEVILKKDLTSS